MGRLTTHILDTANGCPAEGVLVRVYSTADDGERVLRNTDTTQADGRLQQPLLADEQLPLGIYELDFHVGDYFSARTPNSDSPPFLGIVTVRFAVTADSHYHIPLLVAPYGYSTYRGS